MPWRMMARPLLAPNPPRQAPHSPGSDKTSRKPPFCVQPRKQPETPPHPGKPGPTASCGQTLTVGEPGFVGRGRNWGEEGPLFKCHYLMLIAAFKGPCCDTHFTGVETEVQLSSTWAMDGTGPVLRAILLTQGPLS